MDEHLLSDDGCRLWTVRQGYGRPVLLCHGGPGLWDYFGDLADLLAGAVRTVRWDQRGCGRSQRRGPYTVDRFVADLDAVRRHTGAPTAVLLGHSWGALLALRYALVHPDRVEALIYVSGTGIDPEDTWRPEFRQRMDGYLRGPGSRWAQLDGRDRSPAQDREYAVLQWSADFADPATAVRHAESLATPWFPINWECSAALNAEIARYLRDTDVAAACRALAVPTLIVDGDRDRRPRRAVDSLHRALPEATRVTIAGAGHLPWVEDPHRVTAAVTGFLAPAG